MKKNKTKDMTAFDMQAVPQKQNPLLMPLIWGASFFMTRQFRLKIKKINMKGLKPPYLVLSTHQGFADYYIAPLALFPHRANYVSDMEGFAAFGKWLYRNIGCIGKRRYVPDYSVMKNIHHSLFKNKQITVIFPESRHSNVGTTSLIPDNMGRLVKHLGVPLVILSAHGSYLANPFWDEEHTRKSPMEAKLECIYSRQQVADLSAAEIQKRIEKEMQYDEYQWQWDNKIKIDYAKRTEGLHKALYQCRSCGKEFSMSSEGIRLRCNDCQAIWEMDSYGRLIDTAGTVRHIPEWYEWQRMQVADQIKQGVYCLDLSVRIEALPNEKGFVDMGNGQLTFDRQGFKLEMGGITLFFPGKHMESLQTEYNYRGKGSCIVLSTQDCCYYIYANEPTFCTTKLQFAVELMK